MSEYTNWERSTFLQLGVSPTAGTFGASVVPSTSTPLFSPAGSSTNNDFLVRLQSTGSNFYITSTHTQIVQETLDLIFQSHVRDVAVLRSFVHWQKQHLDYQALYTGMLLETISEEEFMVEAEKYATEESEVDPVMLAGHIDELRRLTALDLETSEYASFFNSTQENVVDAMARLGEANVHFHDLLPEGKRNYSFPSLFE